MKQAPNAHQARSHGRSQRAHGEIDLDAWIFGLSDADYQACAKGHHGAGTYVDDRGRGMVNIESIGGHLFGYTSVWSPDYRA